MQVHKIAVQVFIVVMLALPMQHAAGQAATTYQSMQGVVSMASELKAFYNMAELPAYRDGTIMGQTSSYDTTGGNDDGFSGRYSYLRRRPDSSLVLFDVQGPGVINRIWTPTPSDDSLDFYIDDTSHAAFTISYKDLFSGKVPPFVAPLCNNQLGGYYCYLPIPFQRRCMIVYRGKQTQFHQIGYRLFPAGTRVKAFSLALDAEEKATLQRIQTLWNKPAHTVQDFYPQKPNAVQTHTTQFQLRPGEQRVLFQNPIGGRIVGIELEPAAAFESLSKDVDIRITWDNEIVPAVYCPMADFFGYAFGKTSMQSLLLGTNQNKAYCYFPMPFDRSAKVELLYRKPQAAEAARSLAITARIFFTSEVRSREKEGKFYAYWNNAPRTTMGQPHMLLNVSGKGHYVGTALQTRGLEAGMTIFFEGDDSTVIDGQLRMHGTGSEDYFNGGWYAMMDRWDGPLSLPLSGALDYALPLSRTGGYRLFLTDKIPFAKSIHHSIEHGPEGNQAPATYTSVAYYYSNTAPAAAPAPQSKDTKVSMPDTMILYPQLLTFTNAGDIGIRHVWAYPTGGESMIFTPAGEAGMRVQLQEVPDGAYQVLLDYAKLPQGCSFSLWQRQTPLTDWMSSYGADTARVAQQYLSDVTLTPLNNTLTLRFKADAGKNQFFLNRLILVRRKD